MVTTAPSSEHIQINVELFLNAAVSCLQIVSWSHSKVKGISLSLKVAFKDTKEQLEVYNLELINLIIHDSIMFEPGKLLTRTLTFKKW